MENTDKPKMSRMERVKLIAFRNYMEKKKLAEQKKLNCELKKKWR